MSAFSYFYLDYLETNSKQKKAYFDFFQSMDLRFNDLKYKMVPKLQNIQQKTILVAVDDESLDEVGRWPWSRTYIKTLTEKLLSFQVKSVGFDIIFSEPEREIKTADQEFSDFILKNQDKIVLGTFSDNLIHTFPYQDYCINEAFLKNGGDSLIKINPTFVVDDSADRFEDLEWNNFFIYFFNAISKTTEQGYLKKYKVDSIENLTDFQKNYLRTLKVKNTFEYCTNWLTEKDSFKDFSNPQIFNLYKNLFAKFKIENESDLKQQLDILKSESHQYPIPEYGRWTPNTELIQNNSLYTGSFNTKLDVDGFIRRYPLFYRAGNRLGSSFIPSLALQQYLISTGYRADVKIDQAGSEKRISQFTIKDPSTDPETTIQTLPVDSQGQLLIHYYGPRLTLQSVSAKELFSQDPYIQVFERARESTSDEASIQVRRVLKAEYLKDKNVILGATAMALYDLRNTPLDTNFPGPEIHQTVLNNLLNKNYLTHPTHEKYYLPIFLFIYGLIFSYFLYSQGAINSALFFIGLSTAGFIFDSYLYVEHNLLLSSLFFVLTNLSIFITVLIYKYLSEERTKIEIRKTFSKYVAPAVVDELLKDTKNLELGGRKQVMTAFFSDIRGFTEFSEKLDPQTLSSVLNEYLTPMTEIIFKNKGTLDKYMGDAIMAFFGAPVKYKDHAYQACLSALENLEKLNSINLVFKTKGWPQIQIGIGINTGEMSVGNMGSQIVQNYTIMGDAVNLASRLEGATKQYGVKILISETTYLDIQNDFATRYVDTIRVKGKKQPVAIYELIHKINNISEKASLDLSNFKQAIQLYKNKQFTEALTLFNQLLSESSNDQLVQIYIERCELFIKNPPPLNWDGVFDLKTK